MRLPGRRLLRRDVHRQFDELPHRGSRDGAPLQRDHPRRLGRADPPGEGDGDADHAVGQQRPAAIGSPHRGGLCKRPYRGSGFRRLDEHLAPPAGHREGGGRPADARNLQRLQRQDPAPLLHVPRRSPSLERPPPGRRHPRPHAGALPRRPDQRGGTNGHGKNGR